MSITNTATELSISEVKKINDSLSELEKTVSIVCERITTIRTRLLGGEQPSVCGDEAVPSGWFHETLHTLRLLNERLRELNNTKINDLQHATDLEAVKVR